MDHAAYHVIYVDSRVSRDLDGKHVEKGESRTGGSNGHNEASWEDRNPECLKSILGEVEEVRINLKRLLTVFNGVHTCTSGKSSMAKIGQLERTDTYYLPILVLIGTTTEDEAETSSRETSKSSSRPSIYGLTLLQHISSEISSSALSRLVVPVAMIHTLGQAQQAPSNRPIRPTSGTFSKVPGGRSSSPRQTGNVKGHEDAQRTLKCIDVGAVDVLMSPIAEERLHSLTVHAYRAHKDALKERADFLAVKKTRKLSWLGNTDNKPYAYLREKMVSELMTGICNPDEVLHIIDHKKLPGISATKERQVRSAIGSWAFSGHDYSEEELVHAACFMLKHALESTELEKWRLSTADLKAFVMASRAAYNGFVNYHNFRHVIDVMQAIFFFLIQLGTLPSYPTSSASPGTERRTSPIAALLKPFDALTLLITAIGHDVGHPGVNNAFLVSLNAPLAQLYNDRSVLEAFHCAAYSQILRRYWRAAFEDIPMRSLLINSILATDMGVHQKYMSDLGNLQEKLHHNKGTDGWSPQVLDEYRILTCALLVKCADISNVARPFDVAVQWANILQLEFANQGTMEKDVGIPTTLFGGPPELGNLVKLGVSQKSFMNVFARPLFESVTDVLPPMVFAVDEMRKNQDTWTEKIRQENEKETQQSPPRRDYSDEEQLSPRSGSPNRPSSQPEASHPEGLPASIPSPQPLQSPPTSSPADTRNGHPGSGPSTLQHQGSPEPNHQNPDDSRRSSGNPLGHLGSTPDSAASWSRRSSGALSTNNPATVTTRRVSNTSPSQLQLGSDSRSQTNSSIAASENRQPNGRGSEDTLSQTHFPGAAEAIAERRRGSANSGGAGDTTRRGSKGNAVEQLRWNQIDISQTSGRPYGHCGHHRSSSGAHTNNTSVSQSTPYSPTGTQATSVLTVDSDEKSSQGRMGSCTSPERKVFPDISDVEQPGSVHHFADLNGFDSAKDVDIHTSVFGNGGTRDSTSSLGRGSMGRKSSRFNFFHSWRRKGKFEPSP